MRIDDNAHVLFSIHPKWTYKILIETKRIEIRKKAPKLKPPFTCYIYCTKDKKFPLSLGPFGPGLIESEDSDYDMQGKVVGQFTCTEIREYRYDENNPYYVISDDELELTKLTQEQLWEYGKGKTLYGIVISNVVTYFKPLDISYIRTCCPVYMVDDLSYKCDTCDHLYYYECYDFCDEYCMCDGIKPLNRPPQSWQYVEKFDYEYYFKNYKDYPELDALITELFDPS